jgi:hypothetical protein
MYRCMHTYIHTSEFMDVYKYTHTQTHCKQSHRHTHIKAYILYNTHTHTNICIYIYIYICIYVYIHIYIYIYTHTQNTDDPMVVHTHAHTSFPTTCQMQDSTYVLEAIWGVSSLQYTHCLPWQTRPTCILSSQPHATTHSSRCDVSPWNTPSGSAVIWLPPTNLLRHTQGESGEAAASRVRAVHRDALPQKHACKNGLWHPLCKPGKYACLCYMYFTQPRGSGDSKHNHAFIWGAFVHAVCTVVSWCAEMHQ